jgi:uncharacterized membrane protein HdeD (DUF308 family)
MLLNSDRSMITGLLRPQQSSVWWVFLLQGLAAMILGIMLITEPHATLVALTTLFGCYLLVTGILALVQIFVDGTVSRILSLLTGIVGVAAGILIVRHPVFVALTVPSLLVTLLGLGASVMGVFEIIAGFTGGGIGSVLLGVVNVLVGSILISSRFVIGIAVPFVFGLLLLFEGASLILWAVRVRRGTRAVPDQGSIQIGAAASDRGRLTSTS